MTNHIAPSLWTEDFMRQDLYSAENNRSQGSAGNNHSKGFAIPESDRKFFELLSNENKRGNTEEVAALLRGLVFLDDENNYSNELNQFAMLLAAEKRLIGEANGLAKILVKNEPMDSAEKYEECAAKFLVDSLIENEKNIGGIESQGLAGDTVLHGAAKSGCTEVVRMLVGRPGFSRDSLDSRNEEGETPLTLAAKNGHAAVVELLLNNNFSSPMNIHEALELAVENGHLEAVKAFDSFLKSGASNIDEPEKNDLLKLAASKAHWEIASFLFDDFVRRFENKKINPDENSEEYQKNVKSISLDLLQSSAELGGINEFVADFVKKVTDFVGDLFDQRANKNLFAENAFIALNSSSLNAFEVLLDKFISSFKNNYSEDTQFCREIQRLVSEAISFGNKGGKLQMIINALEKEGIDFFEVLNFGYFGYSNKVVEVSRILREESVQMTHNAIIVG